MIGLSTVDGYGTQDQVRSFIQSFKPDIVWIMTDQDFGVGCGK